MKRGVVTPVLSMMLWYVCYRCSLLYVCYDDLPWTVKYLRPDCVTVKLPCPFCAHLFTLPLLPSCVWIWWFLPVVLSFCSWSPRFLRSTVVLRVVLIVVPVLHLLRCSLPIVHLMCLRKTLFVQYYRCSVVIHHDFTVRLCHSSDGRVLHICYRWWCLEWFGWLIWVRYGRRCSALLFTIAVPLCLAFCGITLFGPETPVRCLLAVTGRLRRREGVFTCSVYIWWSDSDHYGGYLLLVAMACCYLFLLIYSSGYVPVLIWNFEHLFCSCCYRLTRLPFVDVRLLLKRSLLWRLLTVSLLLPLTITFDICCLPLLADVCCSNSTVAAIAEKVITACSVPGSAMKRCCSATISLPFCRCCCVVHCPILYRRKPGLAHLLFCPTVDVDTVTDDYNLVFVLPTFCCCCVRRCSLRYITLPLRSLIVVLVIIVISGEKIDVYVALFCYSLLFPYHYGVLRYCSAVVETVKLITVVEKIERKRGKLFDYPLPSTFWCWWSVVLLVIRLCVLYVFEEAIRIPLTLLAVVRLFPYRSEVVGTFVFWCCFIVVVLPLFCHDYLLCSVDRCSGPVIYHWAALLILVTVEVICCHVLLFVYSVLVDRVTVLWFDWNVLLRSCRYVAGVLFYSVLFWWEAMIRSCRYGEAISVVLDLRCSGISLWAAFYVLESALFCSVLPLPTFWEKRKSYDWRKIRWRTAVVERPVSLSVLFWCLMIVAVVLLLFLAVLLMMLVMFCYGIHCTWKALFSCWRNVGNLPFCRWWYSVMVLRDYYWCWWCSVIVRWGGGLLLEICMEIFCLIPFVVVPYNTRATLVTDVSFTVLPVRWTMNGCV